MKYLPSGKMASKINRLSCRKKLLLVNKKKQKNFVNGSAPAGVGAFQSDKSFLLLFFKKDASCFSS